MIDAAGDATQRDTFRYDPYGNMTTETAPTADHFRFDGGYYDDFSNLTLFGTRYYDSETGRWTQPDTLGGAISDPTSNNLYAFANDNPINNVDPTGKSSDVALYFGLGFAALDVLGVFGGAAFGVGTALEVLSATTEEGVEGGIFFGTVSSAIGGITSSLSQIF